MIAAFVTALAVVAPGVPAAPSTPPPPAVDKSPLQTARDNLEQAQQIFAQSCGDRAYGAYDDLCEQLSIQVRQYRVDLDKLERAARGAARPKP